MKHILVAVVSVFFSVLSFAQNDVQGEFWGVSFYGSKAWVSREFSKHAKQEYSGNPNELKFSNGYFGGLSWDGIYAHFYKDSFSRISFIKLYYDLNTAASTYSRLQEKLQQKYASLYSNADASEGNYSYVVFGEKRGCMLSFNIDTEGSETTYSILLMYDCLALSQKQQDLEMDEL